MNKQPDHIGEALLLKYSLGQTSGEEKTLVETWLGNDDNRKEYNKWLRIWQTAEATEKIDKIDVDKNWNELKSRLSSKQQKRTVWLKVAATLLIVAAVLFLIEQVTDDSTSEMINFTAQTDEQLVLPDGSEVWLKAGSQLNYPENFDAELRQVALVGEALFEIEKDPDKPFIIDADESQVKVLGTIFNLRTEDANGRLELVLLEGKVQFNTANEQVILTPGQKVKLGDDGYLTKVVNTNPNFLAWRTGNFVFTNTPMSQVINDLANAYGFTYSFADSSFEICPLTSKYEQESIDSILLTLEALFGAQFNLSNNQLEIIGGQCK